MKNTTTDEIEKIIKELKSKKSYGYDEIMTTYGYDEIMTTMLKIAVHLQYHP
jgi:hypothetical protein